MGLTLLSLFNNCAPANFAKEESGSGSSSTPPTVDPWGAKPTGAIQIESGAPYINRQNVTLNLQSDAAAEMYVSNALSCQVGGSWEPFVSQKTWALEQLNQQAKVYVKYRNSKGESDCLQAAIIHDNIKPLIQLTRKPADFTNVKTESLLYQVTDSGSGVNTSSMLPQSNVAAIDFALNVKGFVTAVIEGTTSVSVKATDQAGNVSDPLLIAWLYDATAPSLSISGPPAVDGNSTANFVISALDGTGSGLARVNCGTDPANLTLCVNNQRSLAGLADGNHTFYAQAVDKAGNASAVQVYNWRVDTTAPILSLTGPSSPVNTTAATFTFSGTDGGLPVSGFQCSLDGAAFSACASPLTVNGLSAGAHSFQVRAVDGVGNTSSPLSHNWIIDLVAPTVSINASVGAVTSSAANNFTISVVELQTSVQLIEYRVDGGPFAAYTGAVALTGLSMGSHLIEARARDAAGNVGTSSFAWTIDQTKPNLTVTGPAGYLAVNSAAVSFSAVAGGGRPVTFQCQLNGSAWVPCVSPTNFNAMLDGTYLYNVLATDSIGNQSDVKSATWIVDTTSPVINIISAPPANALSTDALAINFSVLEANLQTVSCTLNGAPQVCAVGNNNLGTFSPGTYVYSITATDRAGHSASKAVSWVVNPPGTKIDFFQSTANRNSGFNISLNLGAFPFNYTYSAGQLIVIVTTFNSAVGSIVVSDSAGNNWSLAISSPPTPAYGFLSGVYFSRLTKDIPAGGSVSVSCVGCSAAGTQSGSATIYSFKNADGVLDAKALWTHSGSAITESTHSITGQPMNSPFAAMIAGVMSQNTALQVQSFEFLADGVKVATQGPSANATTSYRATAGASLAEGISGKIPGVRVLYSTSSSASRLIYLVTVR